MLLHGGGLSWWNYRAEAELLSGRYHVVLPILDGHAESDHDFTSIEENASRVISFIDREYGGSVLLIGGLSLGAQVLVEMLTRRENICQYAILESASVIPARITHALIRPTFASSYGLIGKKWFAKAQFQYLRICDDLFLDYYRDTVKITKDNMIAFLKASASYALKAPFRDTAAKVHVYVGERETVRILRSAEAICRALPSAGLHRLPGLRHGEFSINHADRYADAIRQIVRKERKMI